MRYILRDVKRGVLAAIGVGAAAVVLAGCSGGSSVDTAAVPTPNTGKSTPHAAAAGAAVNMKLKFDQLQLDSPVSSSTTKGVKYFHFKYTNNDGKVYLCDLPAGMATGEQTTGEWLSVFDVYKQPKVLAQRKVRKSSDGLNDFPFIAPKPEEEKPQDSGAGNPAQQPMPQLPTPPPPAPTPMPSPGPTPPPLPG